MIGAIFEKILKGQYWILEVLDFFVVKWQAESLCDQPS